MASTTRKRAESLAQSLVSVPVAVPVAGSFPNAPNPSSATPTVRSFIAVEDFGIFIDTHRDQPHVPTFEDDLHRGMTRPTLVHYAPPLPTDPPEYLGALIRAGDGRMIEVHEKHKFVELPWWENFVTDYIMANGTVPTATTGEYEGQMPTSHLRDARKQVYHLKSLRQMVRAHQKASATVSGTAYKPKRRGKPIVAPVKMRRITPNRLGPLHPTKQTAAAGKAKP